MHQRMIFILVASILFIKDANSQDSSQKCTCSPCGSPCTNPSPPPPQQVNYPPPPSPTPEYYSPPPPPPSPPPPILPPTPTQPYCPPPPLPPSPPSPTTPSNPCCSPSSRSAPYFGLIPPGQLYPQDPTFSSFSCSSKVTWQILRFCSVFLYWFGMVR